MKHIYTVCHQGATVPCEYRDGCRLTFLNGIKIKSQIAKTELLESMVTTAAKEKNKIKKKFNKK